MASNFNQDDERGALTPDSPIQLGQMAREVEDNEAREVEDNVVEEQPPNEEPQDDDDELDATAPYGEEEDELEDENDPVRRTYNRRPLTVSFIILFCKRLRS